MSIMKYDAEYKKGWVVKEEGEKTLCEAFSLLHLLCLRIKVY